MTTNRVLEGVSREFEAIHSALRDRRNGARLVVKEGGDFQSHSFGFWELLPQWLLSYFAPQAYREENRTTIHYFKEVFGERRIEQLSSRAGINLKEKETSGLPLTRREVSRLFLEMGNIHYEDATELFQFIVTDDRSYAGGRLEKEARHTLAERFRGRNITDLTRAEWDELHAFLVPTQKIETLFLDNVPSFEKSLFSSDFEGFQKGVYITEKIWRTRELDEDKWNAWMSKALIQRQQGSTNVLVPHPQGVLRLFGQYDTLSADISFFQSLTPASLPSMVKFYGMGIAATPSGIVAIGEGFLNPLGKRGMERVEAVIRYLLGKEKTKPKDFHGRYSGIEDEQFVPKGTQGLTAVTQSMGGAVAAQFAMKYPGLFSKYVFVSSPGVALEQCTEFAKRTDDGKTEVEHVIDEGDVITQMGPRLGLGCMPASGKHVRLIVFSEQRKNTQELEYALLNPPSAPKTWFFRTIAFFKGFLGPHWADTTLINQERYSKAFWDNTTEKGRRVINTYLSKGTWEEVREDLQDALV